MEWKTIVDAGKAAYPKYKSGKKAVEYAKLVKGAIDEDTRQGSLFKLGVKATTDIASKVMGVSLSSHPYFVFHKAHLDVLASALNTVGTQDLAAEAFRKAVAAADETTALAKQCEELDGKRRLALGVFSFLVEGSLKTLREAREGNSRALQQTAMSAAAMQKYTDDLLFEQRKAWAGLADEVIQLSLMVAASHALTAEAMARYDQKLSTLKSQSNLGRIAAHGLEQDRMWAEFEAIKSPRSASQSKHDPLGAATKARGRVEELCARITATTDLIFDDRVMMTAPERVTRSQ